MPLASFAKEYRALERERREIFELSVVQEPRLIAAQTFEVVLARPHRDFTFHAGQSMKFFPNESYGASFSLVSAPHDEHLVFAFRDSKTALKSRMRNIRAGERVPVRDVKRVNDTFHYPSDDEANVPIVMIAGGIGVTPFMSMLRQALHLNDTRPFTLITSNPEETHIPYMNELQTLENNGRLTHRKFLTGEVKEGYMHGRFTRSDLESFWREPQPLFYIAGPVLMVEETVAHLASIGVPETRIRAKRFKGYTGTDDIRD